MINDFGGQILPNKLFQNDYPVDSFTEIGAAVNFDEAMDGMSIGIGDFDEDGDLDYYCSDTGPNNFFVNEGGTFVDRASELGIAVMDGTSWGSVFSDYDNDTYLDLWVMNGPIGLRDDFQHENRLFKGNGTTFSDVSRAEGVASSYNSRGLALSDFDNDGRIDYATAVADNQEASSSHALVYKNTNNRNANWIQIELQGTTGNRDAYGSFLELEVNGRRFVKEQSGGGSFMATQSKVHHFGLADYQSAEQLTVTWPGGGKSSISNLAANKRYRIVEGGEVFVVQPRTMSLTEGQTAFLQGADQSTPGIYRDTLPRSPFPIIRITRLDFNGNSDRDDTDGGRGADHSVARLWNELLLESIRNDYARPTVHARNLFHASIAMYDAFAVYDKEAKPYFLGNTLDGFTVPFRSVPQPDAPLEAQQKAMSYACYRLLGRRFKNSPGSMRSLQSYESLMQDLGYDPSYTETDYTNGNPAALGNYLAEQLITFGLQDGSNEANDYANFIYTPLNAPLVVDEPGNPTLEHPNNWQPLALSNFVDQSGNVIGPDIPDFLSPEWGKVVPFALTNEDLTTKRRDGHEYWIYHDPGPPHYIKTEGAPALADPYKWGFALVAIWSSHLDPSDGVMMDISPASLGNLAISDFPQTPSEYQDFYHLTDGPNPGKGFEINPVTQKPYTPQVVPKGDYTRVLAEFWADGPESETPPGHWFTILNYVSDHPLTEKKFNGKGRVLSDLEWDVKTYLALGGAMHDAAVTAWSIKGYYDYIRPISAIRYMARKGQSSDASLPNYHPEGIPLVPGYIEIVQNGDLLAGPNNEHAGKIRLYAWKGTHFVQDPEHDVAGVGWILAENWVPYQRPSFVTPPFAGYVSGHSTFSRAAAEVLTQLTGKKFFPGGMGTFHTGRNDFLVFENGPSADITLQWATYQDAADQCSLSRIWGGIHPPIDDIAGRIAGERIGIEAFELSRNYFYDDNDADGYYSYEDIDDTDASLTTEKYTPQQLTYTLYPVPVHEKLTLNTNYEGKLYYKVFDTYGRLVQKGTIEIDGHAQNIAMYNLSAGVYVLLLEDANGKKLEAQKIIKQ